MSPIITKDAVTPSGQKLLVFAHQDEADAFENIPHLITGIGKINAAVQLSRAIAAGEVSEVIVFGTAGMLDDSFDIETVYRISGALQHDFEFPSPTVELSESGQLTLVDNSLNPEEFSEPKETAAISNLPKTGIPTAVIATGDMFLADDVGRERIGGGAGLVDMETYAYARVCVAFHVPLRVFKVPSDFADSATTHETWDTIVKGKSRQLLDFAQTHQLI